jgi:hypothetical protein
MKKWIILLVLQTCVSASQPHSILGFRGLIFTPAPGDFPKDGESGFGYRNIKTPYTFINWSDKTTENHLFYGSLVFLPGVDFTGVITLAPGSPGNEGSDTYKDFALFAHIQLLKEKKNTPSLMLGIHDFYSYSYYNALFLSSSKSFKLNHVIQINTHLGYGVDWMDKHYGDVEPDRDAPVNHYLVGLFGGVETNYRNFGSFIIEYDTHQINTGIRINLIDHFHILLTVLNKDKISFGMDYNFSLI